MKKCWLFILAMLAMTVANLAYAVRVTTIYQGEVPVASQSDAVRNQALPFALSQVFVKVSGNSKVLDNPNLKSHLKDASALSQEFGYVANKNAAIPYLFTAQFDANAINKILQDASVPLWGDNRPLILALVEYEVPDQKAEIVDSNTNSEIRNLLTQEANVRGLPIILPVMDVTDLNVINVNDIVMMNVAKLQPAAKRYASDAILMTRILKDTNGYAVQAKLVLGLNQWDFKLSAGTLPIVLNTLIDNVTDTLAQRFATVIKNTVQENVTIKVMGVGQKNDYAQMMHYLEHLTPVANVQIVQITGSDVTLSINLRSTRQSFVDSLSAENKLTPVTTASSDKTLVYQWNH